MVRNARRTQVKVGELESEPQRTKCWQVRAAELVAALRVCKERKEEEVCWVGRGSEVNQ